MEGGYLAEETEILPYTHSSVTRSAYSRWYDSSYSQAQTKYNDLECKEHSFLLAHKCKRCPSRISFEMPVGGQTS